MNILVTGGLGVVGRPLVERLIRHGHFVTVLDRTGGADLAGIESAVSIEKARHLIGYEPEYPFQSWKIA
jgi:NAD(P)-dependent dehydrogenase (short-subunit alcohol dehydrogenase family)